MPRILILLAMMLAANLNTIVSAAAQSYPQRTENSSCRLGQAAALTSRHGWSPTDFPSPGGNLL